MENYLVSQLDSFDGERTLAAHVYIPVGNRPLWETEMGNRSLCGHSAADLDGSECPSAWNVLTQTPGFHHDLTVVTCKTCAKIAAKRFNL